MKTFWWIIVAVIAVMAIFLLVAFVGRGPAISQAEANYCADLAAYGKAVVDLRAIDQNSTVEGLQDGLKAVQASWQELRQSGQALRQARLDVVESSFNELEKTINSISDDATLAEANAEVYRAALEGAAQVLEAQRLTCTYQIEPQR
ncbi:MAG TPA: hypothetical protein VEC96_13535 [Anaerolineae bacterium]|nr:hypothetical protein [Anaerolineae bacterium]